MFTEAFLDIQEILDRNYNLELAWYKFFFSKDAYQDVDAHVDL